MIKKMEKKYDDRERETFGRVICFVGAIGKESILSIYLS